MRVIKFQPPHPQGDGVLRTINKITIECDGTASAAGIVHFKVVVARPATTRGNVDNISIYGQESKEQLAKIGFRIN
ncbi:MAG: hypothetical protein HEQ19_02320 [Gloeotrichia echinulata CP02]|nr:hypothetical protein [Gloeotrichia echinulata DEX184]